MISTHCDFGRFSLVAIIGLSVNACAITAPLQPKTASTIDLPKTFDLDAEIGFQPDMAAANWWVDFEDPLMTDLVSQALEHNKTIALAQANLETAQSLLQAQMLLNSVTTASTSGAEFGRGASQGGNPNLSVSGALSASWEYDRFGRIAALIKRSEFDVLQAQETKRDVAVTIAAETASAYVDLRGAQTRQSVALRNIDIQREGLDLLETLFENGRANKLDTERAESQFRTTLSTLPALEADILNAASRLTALTGRSYTSDDTVIARALQQPGPIPQRIKPLLTGTPTDMIRRRPDIRAVEAEIGAALSFGEVERARLFPVITLGGDVSTLFREGVSFSDSFGFGLGPTLRWEGPDLRQVYADIDVADARTRAVVARYEDTVVTALSEIEIALTNYTQERSRLSNLSAAAASAERAVELARLRFEEGLDDYLDVIDAQRTLLTTQDTLERSRLETSRRAITIYRTLGGIWDIGMGPGDAMDTPQSGPEGQN